MFAATHVALSRPGRWSWTLMSVVGLCLVAAGAPAVVGDFWAAPIRAYLFAGAGLFLAGVGGAVLSNRHHAVAVEVTEHGVRIRDNRGGEVFISIEVVADLAVYETDHGGLVLVLFQHDGGVVELASLPTETDVQAFLEPLQAAVRAGQRQGSPDVVPPERLPRGVVERTANRLRVKWRLGWPPQMALPIAGAGTGLALIGLGFFQRNGGLGAQLFLGFALALLAAVSTAAVCGWLTVQRVDIDNHRLVMNRLVAGRVVSTTGVALADIVAVDFTHQINHLGAGLTIRRSSQSPSARALSAGTAEAITVTTVMAALAAGVHVPLGKLRWCDKIAIGLVLSAAVAERVGCQPEPE